LIRRSISTSSRQLPQFRALEDHRDTFPARDSASHHRLQKRLSKAAPSQSALHIYYLPELYSAYFAAATFIALPLAARQAIDPDDAFVSSAAALAYVQTELTMR
jgi:hypothetical protein